VEPGTHVLLPCLWEEINDTALQALRLPGHLPMQGLCAIRVLLFKAGARLGQEPDKGLEMAYALWSMRQQALLWR
jgi:hypothetical protein